MKCYICKVGETASGHAPLAFERDGRLVVLRDVPGEVCDTCGHLYMSADVAVELQGRTEKALAAEGRRRVCSLGCLREVELADGDEVFEPGGGMVSKL